MKKFLSYFKLTEFTGAGGYFEIAKIAYPLIIMSASHTVMQFVDRKFLASNSTLDVSAAFPAGILYFTLFCVYMVSVNFTSALVAQLSSARQNKNCVKAVWNGFYMALAASLIIIFINPYIGEYLIRRFTDDPDIMERELEYFSSLGGSGVFCCLAGPFFAFFSGQGRTLVAAVVSTSACILNIFLDWIFIFGCDFINLPPLGIFGAGIATSICTFSSMAAIIIIYLVQPQKPFATRRHRNFRFEYIKKLLRYGVPSGTQSFLDTGAFTLVSFSFGLMGKESLAASVIAMAINNIFFMPLLGLSDAASIVVGQFIGKKQHDIAEKAAYRSWRIALLYMTLGGVLYIGFPEFLINIFAPQEANASIDFNNVMNLTGNILIAALFFNFCDATKFVFSGSLRGAGDTLAVLLINSCCSWFIMVPGVIYLTFYRKVPVVNLWIFLTIFGCFESILIFWRFKNGNWKKIKLIKQDAKAISNTPVSELKDML